MLPSVLAFFLFVSLVAVECFRGQVSARSHSKIATSLEMGIKLYGSQQTRSPLVNWYLLEKNIPFTQMPPRPNPNPFGQIPYMTHEEDGVEIFESGAILLYLADSYGGYDSPKSRAQYTKWVVWANSELDGMCFGKGMSGTQLDKPNRGLDVLESMLKDKEWLVNNQFSVADVAVGSYLNYVPLFFSSVNPTSRPNIVKYMARCAARPKFGEAFGADHQKYILSKAEAWGKASGGGGFKLW